VSDEKTPKPSEATGTAALMAGWSHGHRDVSGGWLRPTVFGAVDGLVTNASLIAGLGGATASPHTVVLTGVAALVAGAFSMGTGEYVSVTNQNELVHAEVALERKMLAQFPAAEEEELAGYFPLLRGRSGNRGPDGHGGVTRPGHGSARAHPRGAWRRPERAPVPRSWPGWLPCSRSPSAPWCRCCPTWPACPCSRRPGITAVALVTGGMIVGRLTGRSVLRSGLRQLALGALAVGVTFAVGYLIGGGHPS
jgi:Uncharacterized membrane protein